VADPSNTLLKPGDVIAETYEIVKEIGRGGVGAVFLANHRRLPGKRFALKALLSASETVQARFRREAEIASRLGHPNIVEVVDWNTLPDGSPYLVMEFLEGESLEDRMRRGPLTLEATCTIVRQIGSALAAAHRAGVVHRDLKPANVFLSPTDAGGTLADRVKVLDFGISKVRDSRTVQTLDTVLLGTPLYMSPEQATGQNSLIDARTDLFALGAMVYEMLSGRAAFEGDSIATVIYQVVNSEPEPIGKLVPTLPPSVASAITRALRKAPDERFPDIESFIEALTGQQLMTLGGPVPLLGSAGRLAEKTVLRDGAPVWIAPDASPQPAQLEPAAKRAPESLPPARGHGRASLIVVGLVVIGVVGLLIFRSLSPGTATAPGPDAAVAALADAGPDAATQPGPDAQALVEAGPDASAPFPDAAAVRVPRPEVLSPEVEKELAAAQALLDQGRFQDAQRAAVRSLNEHPSARARRILAMAHCGAGQPHLAMDLLRTATLPAADVRAVCDACARAHSTMQCPP
jgi:serine/threonine-protein kinase